MITHLLIFFLDSSAIVQYNHAEFSIYSLGRDNKFSGLLGFATDRDEAKDRILSNFTYVSNIIAILSNIKSNKSIS